MQHKGDIALSQSISFPFTTNDGNGAPSTLSAATVKVYKNGTTTNSTSGVTTTIGFNSITGMNMVVIDTSSDGSFYSAGADFDVVLTAGTVDATAIISAIGSFSINNRTAVRPTVAGRTLDVSSGGEAGLDWANIGSPTTTVNLSGTTIATATSIAALLPAALVSGRMDSSVGAYQSGQAPLQPTVAGRTLDVSVGGEAGVDWANVGSPTTTLNLSGTTIKAVTDAPSGILTTSHFDTIIGTPATTSIAGDIAQVESNVLAIDVELNGALTLAQFLALK